MNRSYISGKAGVNTLVEIQVELSILRLPHLCILFNPLNQQPNMNDSNTTTPFVIDDDLSIVDPPILEKKENKDNTPQEPNTSLPGEDFHPNELQHLINEFTVHILETNVILEPKSDGIEINHDD